MARGRWRDIADDLRARIEQGEYSPGSRLPVEAELCGHYGASNGAVRRALAELTSEGLIVARPWHGTFVRDREAVRVPVSGYAAAVDPARPAAHLGPWEAACAEQGLDGLTEVLEVDRVPADTKVAGLLGVAEGSELIRRRRRMWAGDQVAQLQSAWMPASLVAGTPLEAAGKIIGGVYAAMTVAGFSPATASVKVISRMATAAERTELKVRGATPVLETWRVTSGADGQPLEVVHAVIASDVAMIEFDQLPLLRG